MIRIKRAYDNPEDKDGKRFLVDRLWPRGVKKESLKIEKWIKEAAPSTNLRKSFGHKPDKWDTFREKYREELENDPDSWKILLKEAKTQDITLIYAAKNRERNNAVVLKRFLDEKLNN